MRQKANAEHNFMIESLYMLGVATRFLALSLAVDCIVLGVIG